MGKINIVPLIKEHYNTLYLIKYIDDKEVCEVDYKIIFILFFLPLVIGVCIVLILGFIKLTLASSLLTCLSILSPLMFGFFPIIYDLTDNEKINPLSKNYIKEFKSNVLFTMVLSFFTLAMILLFTLIYSHLNICYIYIISKKFSIIIIKSIKFVFSVLIYYLIICLALHILMIIQRFNFLINEFVKFHINNKNT